MVKFPLGGIMFLRESLEERNVILTMDELKTGNITSARTCRGWRIKMSGQDLRLLPWHGKNGLYMEKLPQTSGFF